MMEFLTKQEQLNCQEADLLIEKTIVEERLSTAERSSVRGHLENCERCRNAHRLIEALPMVAEAAAAGDYDAEISSVMTNLRYERAAEKKRSTRLFIIGIAASFTAVLLYGVWSMSHGEAVDAPMVETASVPCSSSASVELVPGVSMTHCEGREPGTLIEGGAVQVSLRQGAVALSVDPNRPGKKPVSVKTPGGEVRVKGTLFAVYVNRSDERVEVFRGVVEVISDSETEETFDVAAGHGGKLKSKEVYTLVDPLTENLIAALPQDTENHVGQELVSETESAATAPEQTDEQADVALEEVDENDDARQHTVGEAGRRTTKSMESLIEEARSCLLSHDWQCAAAQYQKVLKRYSRHPESSAVLISLAKIELRHLNSPQQALTHFNMYLKKAPSGPLAEEALLGTAKSYRKLGQTDAEKQALTRFLQKFPQSSLAAKAKARLAEL